MDSNNIEECKKFMSWIEGHNFRAKQDERQYFVNFIVYGWDSAQIAAGSKVFQPTGEKTSSKDVWLNIFVPSQGVKCLKVIRFRDNKPDLSNINN